MHNIEKVAHFSRKYGPKRAKTALSGLLGLLLRLLERLAGALAAFCGHLNLFPPFRLTFPQTYSAPL